MIELKIKTGFPDIYGNEIWFQEVGVLSSVKRFLEVFGGMINQRIKGFYFDKKEIYISEDRSFTSLGIIKDSEIKLILDKNK